MNQYRWAPFRNVRLEPPRWAQNLVAIALGTVALGALSVAVACGGNDAWKADVLNATDIANGAASLEAVCDRDGGPCPAAAVRAMERGTYCAATSMLVRHGESVPDAGIICKR